MAHLARAASLAALLLAARSPLAQEVPPAPPAPPAGEAPAPAPAPEAPPPAAAPPAAGPPVAERGSGVEGTEGEVTAREPVVRKLQLSDFADLRIRVRIQPRIDAGDLVPSEDGRSYDFGHDTYLRRVRLSFTGDVLHTLHYVVTLDGDRVSQAGRPNQVHLTDAALEWRPAEALQLRFGRAKLPITRIGLTSSARQLLVDRPVSMDAARGFLGDVNQANLLLHGRLGGGVLAWYAAAADGWNAQDALYGSSPGQTVRTSTPAGVLRAELAPPGFTEGHKADSHLGVGRHLVVGATLVGQHGIEYQRRDANDPGGRENRALWGVDLSGHAGPFTAQTEWVTGTVDSTTRGKVTTRGWYAQAGVYLPHGLEPAARVEEYDENVDLPESRQRIATGGLNWYARGHSLKLQANVVRKALDRNATGWLPDQDKVTLYQLQLQLYL
jgi:phosphate-selective porin O/P